MFYSLQLGCADRVVLSEDCKSFVYKVRLLRIPLTQVLSSGVRIAVFKTVDVGSNPAVPDRYRIQGD